MPRLQLTMLREKKNISLTRMASDLDISFNHLRGIEKGRANPTLKLAFKIARYLNATVDAVFGDSF